MPVPPATHRVRTPEEKLRLVALSVSLAEPELGAMLRREGIDAAQLEQWRNEMLAALTSKSKTAPAEPAARAEDRRRIQQLEREIDRKDKALAEAATLLIQQKSSPPAYSAKTARCVASSNGGTRCSIPMAEAVASR